MTHWHTIVSNSETLSAADLGPHTPTVTITAVDGAVFEDDAGKKDKKALLTFAGKDKKLAANTINCMCIEAMFGPDVEGWVGHAITLVADKVEVAGHLKGQPCIRIKGSPELHGPVTVDIKLPRRKPFQRRLVPTAKAAVSGDESAHTHRTAPDAASALRSDDSGLFGGDAA